MSDAHANFSKRLGRKNLRQYKVPVNILKQTYKVMGTRGMLLPRGENKKKP